MKILGSIQNVQLLGTASLTREQEAVLAEHDYKPVPLLDTIIKLRAEIRERCEEGNDCSVRPGKTIYHEGCDGAFCVHGICQECGAELELSDA